MKSAAEPVDDIGTVKPRPRLWLFASVVVLVVAIDQASKAWAVANLSESDSIDVIGSFITFALYFNPGAAFGTGAAYTLLLSLVAIGVSIALIFLARQLRDPIWTVGMALFLGGALGNLIDRVFREPSVLKGHVVDFINYNGWFVGNVADIALTVAAIMVVLRSWQGIRLDGSKEKSTHTPKD